MSRGERFAWVFALLGAGMVALPFVSGDLLESLGTGRFALVFVGAIIALSAPLIAWLLRSRNRARADLQAGRDLIAQWNYAEAEWRAFAGDETARQASSKHVMLWVTAGFMVVATLVAVKRDPQAGVFVGGVLFVTWIICWLVARASVRAQARRETAAVPAVRIGSAGLLIGDELHVWRGWGNLLESCKLAEGPPPMVEITYSMQGRRARQYETVRVPVPAGREAEAAEVVRRLQR